MSQPPYPPHGGSDAGGDRSGAPGWNPPGDDDPTRQFGAPADEGQRDATRQFGSPRFGPPGQPSYGPPSYGPPGYVQPLYGQQPGQPPTYPGYGMPPYPEYGQQPYDQSAYPSYGPPPYGRPWGPPGAPGQPPEKKRTAVIALVAGVVLLLAAIGAGLFFLLGDGDPGAGAAASGGFPSTAEAPSAPSVPSPPPPSPGGDGRIPSASVPPDGLGNDPDLDELAQECFDGDMDSCDDLYEEAELDSLYALYGGTCAGRQAVADADTIFCVNAFPED